MEGVVNTKNAHEIRNSIKNVKSDISLVLTEQINS